MDGIPTLCHSFLPLSDVLSQTVVVGLELVVTGSLLGVELVIVVVELTLHGVVRSDSGDRVLDGLHPTFAVTLLVAVIVERNDVVLKQRVDGSSVELILIALVLVGALLGKSPAGTLTITLNPPSVEHGEVYDTVHLGLLTRCT